MICRIKWLFKHVFVKVVIGFDVENQNEGHFIVMGFPLYILELGTHMYGTLTIIYKI